MNIFFCDSDPQKAVEALDDKRLIKMILESTQMLCTALNEAGIKTPYKSTHLNHPCNKWVRENRSNFATFLAYTFMLSMEYSIRFNKVHKCVQVLDQIYKQYSDSKLVFPKGKLIIPPNCTENKEKGISFKHIKDTIFAYRSYLIARWNTDTRKPIWTGRNPPEWAIRESNGLFKPYSEAFHILYV